MSKRRIAARHIGHGHEGSIEREAERLEHELELERRRRLAEASGGDQEHAGRIADVIRLPRDPILDFQELYDPPPAPERELDTRTIWAAWGLAALTGLAAWAVLAAIAGAIYELVRWLG